MKSKIDKSKWVIMYNEGQSATKIARKYNVTPRLVYKYFEDINLSRRTSAESMMFNVPINNILSEFDNGISVSKLASKYRYSITGMSKLLKQQGRIIKQPQDVRTSDWSFVYNKRELFLYWLGWMLSDGCIHFRSKDGRTRGVVTYLTTQYGDVKILEFFRDHIDPARAIIRYRNATRLDLSIPRKEANHVAEYGLIPAKSLILKPTQRLIELSRREFMQLLVGYIEGDGTVRIQHIKSRQHVYDALSVGISCGSRAWLNWINAKLVSYGYKSRTISRRTVTSNFGRSGTPKTYNGCYDYRIVGSEAVKLCKELLSCQYHQLDRKWDKVRLFNGL